MIVFPTTERNPNWEIEIFHAPEEKNQLLFSFFQLPVLEGLIELGLWKALTEPPQQFPMEKTRE